MKKEDLINVATTCTPSPVHIKMMLQASDTLPLNFGFTGKGNTSKPEGIVSLPRSPYTTCFSLRTL